MPSRKKIVSEIDTQELKPIAPSVAMPFSTEAPGAIAPLRSTETKEISTTPAIVGEIVTSEKGLSDMTTRLLAKADELTNTINAKAMRCFEANEEFLMGLVDGSIDLPQLISRYGLTDDVTATKQLQELSFLSNSIQISIASKSVERLALKDVRRNFQIAEEQAKIAGQVQDTANEIDETRHKQVMTAFRAQIRSHKERGKSATVQIEEHAANKKSVKRDGFLGAMGQVKNKQQNKEQR